VTADAAVLVLAFGCVGSAGLAAWASTSAARQGRRRTRDADALVAVAASAADQAAAVRRLADASAEGMRVATGSYVFELRDRFDAALPVVQAGTANGSWAAVGAEEPLELLVLHPGDRVAATVQLGVSQAIPRRKVRARWLAVPEGASGTVGFAARNGLPTDDGGYELPADTPLFVDLRVELDAGRLVAGRWSAVGVAELEVADTRPEGAVCVVPIEVSLEATVVPDGDGVGLDAPVVQAVTFPEQRSYFLDKATGLPLALPVPVVARA
jgi:hypothetical protein